MQRHTGVDLELLAKVNNLEDATEIETGGSIFIPNAEKALEVEIYRPADSHVKRYLSLHLLIEGRLRLSGL